MTRSLDQALAALQPPVRQTVLSGPATSGAPSFLPATTSGLSTTAQNVSPTSPLVLTAAQGFGAGGGLNVSYAFTTNPTWSGLTASTTNFLFVNASTGATSVSTLAPIYQFGGAPSTTSGQFTFDYQAMVGYLGNGSSAIATPLVVIGEAVTNASTVTSTVAYAYQGAYDSGWTATLPGPSAGTTRQHNIGVQPLIRRFIIENTTTEAGYSVGDQVATDAGLLSANSTYWQGIPVSTTRNGVSMVVAANGYGLSIKNTGGATNLTYANWKYKFVVQRGW